MRKGWRRLRRRSWMKLRSAPPDMAFIFRSWMRTSICRRFCRAFSGLGSGWHPGLDKRAANREAWPSKKLQEPMENWGEGQEKVNRSGVWCARQKAPNQFSIALPFAVRCFHTLIRFNLGAARWAPVITTATPNIDPLSSIIGTAIVIDELCLLRERNFSCWIWHYQSFKIGFNARKLS
jgi:hypothetical protein